MTSFLRRVLSPLALLALTALPGRAWAITENYCSFPTSLTTFTLNGNAFEADQTVIRLTAPTVNEAGSAFITTPLSLTATTSLHASFRFTMGSLATGGDGIAFVLQSSAAGAAALGGTDGNLGFLGTGKIAPAVVVDFVTDAGSGGLTTANRVGLLTLTGTTTTVVTQGTPSFTMASATSAMVYAWVDYTPGLLSVYLSNTATKPATALISNAAVNLFTQLGATAYVGFTASTGNTAAKSNQQDVYELELSTDGIPCTCEGDAACTGAAGTPACGGSGICAICSATNHTACVGATPVCNTATSTCVGCLTNANCSGSTPICNTTTHTCGPCTANTDCSGNTPYCDKLAGSANLGTCVACTADANCPVRCNLTTNTCTQCLTNGDCGGNTPICKSGKCSACAGDSDCTAANPSTTTPACEVWGACGQCSATNASQCTGGTGVCDFPTGTCVHCEFNTDCAGATPVCNTTTHTCGPCTTNADCAGNPNGPACVPAGQTKAGQCVLCEQNSDCSSAANPVCDATNNTCVQCLASSDCHNASTPVCNTATNLCVGCQSTTDCTNPATPVCDTTTMTCQPCLSDYSTSNPGPDPCPNANQPACQPSGAPLAGHCGTCSSLNNSQCATQPTTPVCNTTTATCGCNADTDCAANFYCDSSTPPGVCKMGCRVVDGGATNCATGEYCTVMNGGVGQCMGEPCNANADCTNAATPVCNTIAQPHVCVQCLNDPDCPTGQVCNGASNLCVQCTPNQTKNCTGNAPVCLANGTCGCAMDSDCGGASSGMICDTTTQMCAMGCRGMGGNGCAPGMTCTSTSNMAGTCTTGSSSSSSSSSSSGSSDAGAGGSGTDAGTGGGGQNFLVQSTGCGCVVAGGDDDGGAALLGLAGILAAFGLTAGRGSRRRRKAG